MDGKDREYESDAWKGRIVVHAPPGYLLERLGGDIEASGGELLPDPLLVDAIGATMFDVPSSEDGSLTVLLPQDHLQSAPSQALVRISSRDGKRYLGVVTKGPFAEPDSLRGDSQMLVNVAARGGIYLPPHHGRIQVSLLGEQGDDESLRPPLLRPLPNSPVHVLTDAEAAKVLGAKGDIRLGLASNYRDLEVRAPSTRKDVFPRHTAVLGTTGGGKSTTIARLVQQAQSAGMAVILLDIEGEYTYLHEPTGDDRMLQALKARGLEPAGVPKEKMILCHLVGRDTANPDHPNLRAFSLKFDSLSPYAVSEILELPEAQHDRFLKAYDITKQLMRELRMFPRTDYPKDEQWAVDVDEFERGHPFMTLPFLLDVVRACLAHVDKREIDPRTAELKTETGRQNLQTRIGRADLPKFPSSWTALVSKLSRLERLRVFDNPKATPIRYDRMLQPGLVSIIDLSDSGMSELSNIVIADLLHGIQEAQDKAYDSFERAQRKGHEAVPPSRVLIIIEEAHEFLSKERIQKMPILFEQVARIAKRGRKRWLGLVFVTQLPQHLPEQVFGLVNSYILHKITDPQVVSSLQRTVSGIDEGLWKKLPGLAPGQAIVSFPHMTMPLLVAMDPTPAKLRLID